jgi:hypothetical protein
MKFSFSEVVSGWKTEGWGMGGSKRCFKDY